MNYKREIDIDKILYEVGDEVNLPLRQSGVIVYISDNPWGFNHKVRITHGTFNEVGDIEEYKTSQFT